jgi:Ca2+-binding RTX toxin-like protein
MNITTWKKLLDRKLSGRGKRRRATQSVASENLEQRVYLSAAASLVNNELLVLSDADETIAIGTTTDGKGNLELLINGQPHSGLATVQSSQISSIRVIGGAGSNLIDLSRVIAADFSFVDPVTGQPTSVYVDGGNGDDTILGSFDLNDTLFGGDGDDIINFAPISPPSNPLNAGPAALNASPLRALAGTETANVINGTDTVLFESVGIVGDAVAGSSTGTLIAPKFVLTSAQNVTGLAATDARFTLGTDTFASVAITIHPDFDAMQLGTDAANDLAIIELDRAVTGVAPSPLYRNAPAVNDLLTIVGFGAGGDGTAGQDMTFGTKRSGTTPVDVVTPTLIQWSFDNDTESNIAPGDTGGPNFVQIGTELFLAGISSFNSQPNAAIGDVASATRIDAYASWIDFVVGTPGTSNRQGNLTIDGGDGNDTLNGADGNDTINGGDGNDTILGWIGDDVLAGGDGDDTIDGHDGADSITGGDGADSIVAGDGDDTANGGVGNDTVVGEGGNDSLFGGGDDDMVLGDGRRATSPGDDTVFGNSGDDILTGGGGNDVIDGGDGDDQLDSGDQSLSISDAIVGVEGDFGQTATAEFTVTLSRPSALTVTADVVTIAGTATAGFDYELLNSTITFAPGVVTQTVSVPIIGDTLPEINETFFVQLVNVSNAVVIDAFGTAVIEDDGDGVQQVVFLDFDSATNFFVGDHFYTQAERDAIQTRLEEIYGNFTVLFTQTRPVFGLFSTILMNQLPPSGQPGGFAFDVDFRNLNLSGNAVVDVNGLLGGFGQPTASSTNFVELTAKVAAHELGHLMGLRHGDAYGPIGSGIGDTPGSVIYTPAYPGPVAAIGTTSHIMASGATGEITADALSGQSLGARSAVKLAFFSFQGQVLSEQFGTHATPITAQPISLADLVVPNTELTGSLAGLEFNVDATTVVGALQVPGEVDLYSFNANAGQLLNMELMSNIFASSSNAAPRYTQLFDTQISVVDASGAAIPYYAGTAINDNEFESTDSILIDLMIPTDGTYYIRVESATGVETGNYELFVYSFAANAPATDPVNGTVVPSTAGVTLIGGAGNDTLGGTENGDLLIGNGGNDVIVAVGGDDTVYGGGGADLIDGGDGNDQLDGQGGRDTITGGAGNDFIDGGTSSDFIYGDDIAGTLSGNDTITGSAGADFIAAGMGDDIVYGGNDDDTIFGEDGQDTIFGQGGADVINGGAGDDMIVWKQDGQDVIDGTDGRDQVEVRGTSGADSITVGQSGSTLTVTGGGATLNLPNALQDFANGLEELVINGGNGADQITITDVNNVGSILITANGQNGDDTISAAGAMLGVANLQLDGGNGNDTLTGSTGSETLRGSAGDDSLSGGDGDDTLVGGDGQDVLNGDAGRDILRGNFGNDTLDGGDGDDTLEGNEDSDILSGGDGNDSISGGLGNDVLDGKSGDDILFGGDGKDVLLGGAGDDTLDGGRNQDTLRGHSGNDKLRGDHGNDMLFGGTGNDTIDGGDGEDTIDGGSGNDGIVGGNGNDQINGMGGNDTILGGDGDDLISGGAAADTLLGQEGDDGISGNGSPDVIDGGEGVNNLSDADSMVDRVFTSGMPFELTAEILANIDASN